jgi:hypothetical protein
VGQGLLVRTLGARHNHATIRGNVDSSNGLIMSLEFVLKCEIASGPAVELDIDVPSNRECLPVSGEGVVGDWVVEQVVNFWISHVDFDSHAIGVALYHRCTSAEIKFVDECVIR